MELENRIAQLDRKLDLLIEKMDPDLAGRKQSFPETDLLKEVEKGCVEELEVLVNTYKEESGDPLFSEYLFKVGKEIEKSKERVKALEADLDRAYQIYKGTEEPVKSTTKQETPVFDIPRSFQPEAPRVPSPQTVPASSHIPSQQTASSWYQPSENMAPPSPNMPSPQESVPSHMTASGQAVPPVTEPRWTPMQPTHMAIGSEAQNNSQERKNTMEFRIGAGLLSVIGIMFVLIAFVTFGLNFLSGMIQGVSLYMISAGVLAVSELLIKRKNERFSIGITGLGICSLYAATIINYLYLNNFGGIIAIILTLIIAGLSLFISRSRDSGMIRIISFVGCYICFFPVGGFETDLNFIIVTMILFVVNMVGIFYPVKTNRSFIHYTHMIGNTVLTFFLTLVAFGNNVSELFIVFYLITAVIVANTIFLRQERAQAATICYSAQMFFYGLFILFTISDTNFGVLTVILLLSVSVLFFVIENTSKERWIHYYFFVLMFVFSFMVTGKESAMLFAVLAAFIAVKVTADCAQTEALNVIISILAALIGIAYWQDWIVWLYFAAFFVSIFRIKRIHYFHEICTALFMVCHLILSYEVHIYLPAATAVLCVLMYIVPRLPFLSEKKNNAFYYFVFSLLILFYFGVPLLDHPLSFALMLILGIFACIAFAGRKYGLPVRNYHLITAIFLTYMTLSCNLKMPIFISIILMGIAIASVIAGFHWKEKPVRLYGLFLSLFVCAKLVCYDFLEVESLQRIVLFLVVGMIALGISFTYIYLEKALRSNFDTAPDDTPADKGQ